MTDIKVSNTCGLPACVLALLVLEFQELNLHKSSNLSAQAGRPAPDTVPMRKYGEFIGKRYRATKNIMWITALRIGVAELRERYGITPPSEEDWILLFDDNALKLSVPGSN